MQKFTYKIIINQPQEIVFKTMTDKSLYAEWAKVWGEGMSYEGEWQQGAHMAFFDQTRGGTKVVFEACEPYEYIRAKHIAMVDPQQHEIELTDEAMQKWIGTLEEYRFVPLDEQSTELEVTMTTDEMFKEMSDVWPQALEILKGLCERRR